MGQKYIFVVITAVTTARKEVCEIKVKNTFQLEITDQVLVLKSSLNSPCHGKKCNSEEKQGQVNNEFKAFKSARMGFTMKQCIYSLRTPLIVQALIDS